MTTQQSTLANYQLLELIATGGMGEVFLAQQQGAEDLHGPVVVKRLLRHIARDREFVLMFLNEARWAALLAHPNIVHVHELGEERGTYFIAMEYVAGLSARGLIRAMGDVRWPVELAVYVALEALKGLHHAHSVATGLDGQKLRLIHRDVSPDNLLLGESGIVKVTDFGVAKALGSISTTRSGVLKGKYPYMAPEQFRDEPLDHRIDVYGMGVVLYELLTGVRPFRASSDAALMGVILNDAPVPPSLLNPAVSPELEALVLRALAKRPEDRFASAFEMGNALYPHIADQPTGVLEAKLARAVTAGMRRTVPPVAPQGTKRLPAPASAPIEPVAAIVPKPSPTTQLLTVKLSRSAPPPPDRTPRRRIVAGAGGALALCAIALLGIQLSQWAEEREALGVSLSAEARSAAPGDEGALEVPTSEVPVAEAPAGRDADAEAPLNLQPAEKEIARAAPPPKRSPSQAPSRTRSSRTRTARKASPEPAKPAAPALVEFRIYPWAEVWISGRKHGTTPFAPVSLAAGDYTLRVRNQPLAVDRTIQLRLREGEARTVRLNLEKR